MDCRFPSTSAVNAMATSLLTCNLTLLQENACWRCCLAAWPWLAASPHNPPSGHAQDATAQNTADHVKILILSHLILSCFVMSPLGFAHRQGSRR